MCDPLARFSWTAMVTRVGTTTGTVARLSEMLRTSCGLIWFCGSLWQGAGCGGCRQFWLTTCMAEWRLIDARICRHGKRGFGLKFFLLKADGPDGPLDASSAPSRKAEIEEFDRDTEAKAASSGKLFGTDPVGFSFGSRMPTWCGITENRI